MAADVAANRPVAAFRAGGTHVVRLRGAFFATSAVVLMVMWATFIIQVLAGT